MALGDRFGGEEKGLAHETSSQRLAQDSPGSDI
jgi:hypothetical protein